MIRPSAAKLMYEERNPVNRSILQLIQKPRQNATLYFIASKGDQPLTLLPTGLSLKSKQSSIPSPSWSKPTFGFYLTKFLLYSRRRFAQPTRSTWNWVTRSATNQITGLTRSCLRCKLRSEALRRLKWGQMACKSSRVISLV